MKIFRIIGALLIAVALMLPLSFHVSAADYTADGVADDVQVQAALNALPATGGKVTLGPGTYNFTATVSRAIDNVIIEGASSSTTILNYNGVNPVFSIGAQKNWVFRNLKTDAGGINTTGATNWIEDNVTIGATTYNYRSAFSFTATGESPYTLNPTGVNDQDAINNALSTHRNILLGVGTFNLSGSIIIPANTKIIGIGNTTILNFQGSQLHFIFIPDASNIELGNFRMTGSVWSWAGVYIISGTYDVSNIFIHDINSQATGGTIFNVYADATNAPRSVSNVVFARNTVTSPDGFGFIQDGNGASPTIQNITYYKNTVTNAGVASTRTTIWITGYDFAEWANLSVSNINVIDCAGDGAWESVYHYEVAPTKSNCTIVQSSATNGGLKTGGATYGYGFLYSAGVSIYTSSATNNTNLGFAYWDGGAYVSAGGTVGNLAASGNGSGGTITQTKYNYTVDSQQGVPPSVSTSAASSIGGRSAILNGNLSSLGTASSVSLSFEWGLSTSYGNTIAASTPVVTGTGVFYANLGSLNYGTTYHYRAKAVGTSVVYASDQSFTTSSLSAPIASTVAASNVSLTTATLNGNLSSMGSASSVAVTYQYGLTTSYGSTATASESPMSGTGTNHANITGLSAGTTYHFRVKVVGDGTSYGADVSFTTKSGPSVSSSAATNVAATTATLNGNLGSLGSAASVAVSFEYGATTAYGSTATASESPLSGTGVFHADIGSLVDGTTYHFRAKAVGDSTVYGSDLTFNHAPPAVTAPTVSTSASSGTTATTVTLNGNLTALGSAGSVSIGFEYGLTVSYGNSIAATGSPVGAPTTFSANLTGLTASTTYHYRSYASGDLYTNGSDATFTTSASSSPPSPSPTAAPEPPFTPPANIPTAQSTANSAFPLIFVAVLVLLLFKQTESGSHGLVNLVVIILVIVIGASLLSVLAHALGS